MTWVGFGRFGRPHGVRGELRVWPYNPQSPLLVAGRTIQLGEGESPTREARLLGLRFDAKGAVVRLDGVDDREAAEALNGWTWFESREAFPAIEEDEFYVIDLIGLAVRDDAGEPLGEVTDVLQHSPTDTYVVRGPDGEVMIPAIDTYIVRIDLAQREMIVRGIDELRG